MAEENGGAPLSGSAEETSCGPPWAGVCISGGGSRAVAAAMGELRGLAALGLLSRIGWLSTISRATWVGTLLDWAPPTWSDATLLGPLELSPERLRWESGSAADNLSQLDPHALGAVATQLGLAEMPRSAARPGLFGDGGNLENQGLVPLLRRDLRKIIAFVNTGAQLSMSRSQVIVDADLPPLFGVEWSDAEEAYVAISSTSPLRFDQVFDHATFDDLRHQLWSRAQAGATAMAVQTGVTVLPNARYGVPGGTTDLLWIYLHPVNAWYRELHPTVRRAMELAPLDYALFPNYDPVAQPRLNAHQANLLAHLACWNVAGEAEVGGFRGNAAVVRGFLGC